MKDSQIDICGLCFCHADFFCTIVSILWAFAPVVSAKVQVCPPGSSFPPPTSGLWLLSGGGHCRSGLRIGGGCSTIISNTAGGQEGPPFTQRDQERERVPTCYNKESKQKFINSDLRKTKEILTTTQRTKQEGLRCCVCVCVCV